MIIIIIILLFCYGALQSTTSNFGGKRVSLSRWHFFAFYTHQPHKKEDDDVETKHTLIIIFLSIHSYRTYKIYPQEPNLWESQHM